MTIIWPFLSKNLNWSRQEVEADGDSIERIQIDFDQFRSNLVDK